MPHMTPEFWAIVVAGALIWWAVTDGINRLEKMLVEIHDSLLTIQGHGELAPWVANQPEPDISDLSDRKRS